jgi:hypothetical protein
LGRYRALFVEWVQRQRNPSDNIALEKRFMTNYRRNFIEGGSYFFTVNLADGFRCAQPILRGPRCDCDRAKAQRRRRPFPRGPAHGSISKS